MELAGFDVRLIGLEAVVDECLTKFEEQNFVERFWRKDTTLWKTEEDQQKIISNSMGWLDSPQKIKGAAKELSGFAAELGKAGFRHVLHMGMGGSSLAPLVLFEALGRNGAGLPVTVLDTTDPATVIRLERNLPIPNTFFIEASKSGSTIESRSFGEYFLQRVKSTKGIGAGENFAVITDPGSMLERLAEERSYRKIFLNYSDIGGRYSALSYFGLVPAALMGINLEKLLSRASAVVKECRSGIPLKNNPGVVLGVIMGQMALSGRDKLTLLLPGPIASFGMWLEQLIAESTGKEGKGIVPVAREPIGSADVYGQDRLFVEFRIENEPDAALEDKADKLRKADHPVVTVYMRDRLDLGRQFFLWEMATATSGAVLLIDPFDQPNVQEAKTLTGKVLEEVSREGRVPEAHMELEEGPLRMYLAGGANSVRQALSLFFNSAAGTDYLGLLAYLTENEATKRGLQKIRATLRDHLHIATTVGYGPRYLHSTGQLHKGGPNSGLFLLLTTDNAEDVGIPGQPYTFGMLMRAQALGDFEALRKHRRRVLRVHITGAVDAGLAVLDDVIGAVLSKK